MTIQRARFLLVALAGVAALFGALIAVPAVAQESVDCYPIPEEGCTPGDEVVVESEVEDVGTNGTEGATPGSDTSDDDSIALTSSDTEVLSNVLARTGVTVETLVVVGSLLAIIGVVLVRRGRSKVAQAP